MEKGLESSNRRQLDWKKVNTPKTWVALSIATVFGAGLLPLAPGTWGAAAALPFAFYSQAWDFNFRILFWVSMTLIGTWSALVFDQTMKTDDNQNIVIDEFVGIGISSWTAGHDWKTWVAAFILFRFFDAVKPPPIRQVDLWSKNRPYAWVRAWGVILDDLVAGFVSLFIILILQWQHILP